MIFLVLLLIINPVQAYNSGDAIIIKRKAPRKQALLDRKFVFIQEGVAFKPNSTHEVRGLDAKRWKSKISKFSTPQELPTQKTKSTTNAQLPTSNNQQKTTMQNEKSQNIYTESNWDTYAIETEESLGVRAWITNLQDLD